MNRGIALILALVISGCAVKRPMDNRFALEIVPINGDGQTRHVKYDQVTGEAWWASDTTWIKIEDKEALPVSTYKVKIVPTETSWRAIRIDTVSGDAWKNSRGKWIPFTEEVKQ